MFLNLLVFLIAVQEHEAKCQDQAGPRL